MTRDVAMKAKAQRWRLMVSAAGVFVAACVSARSGAALGSLSAQTSPSPITFGSGSWQFALGGYVKLDLIHDFDPNSSSDSFDPRSIPVDGSKGTNTRVHARQTRLSLGIAGPAEGRDLELFLEGDFYGTGNTFRVRHAYAQYGVLLTGQTWTTVMDERQYPADDQLRGAIGRALRPTRPSAHHSRTLKAQRSGVRYRGKRPGDPDPTRRSGNHREAWPDFTTRFRFNHSRGHVQLSGFVGRARFRAAMGGTNDVTIGGVLVSSRLRLLGRDAAYGEVAYGPGLGRYRGGASAELDASGRLKTVHVIGLTAGYEHYWSARWSSNAVVSPAWVLSEVSDLATSNDSFNYVAVNLLYWFLEQRAWIGGEYLYGRRELQNGAHGSGNRIQVATSFNILK